MHRFFVEIQDIPPRGVEQRAPTLLDKDARDTAMDAAMTALLSALGGDWQRLGFECACVDGAAILTIELSLDAGASVGVLGAWVRSRSGRPWSRWAIPLLGVTAGVCTAVLQSTGVPLRYPSMVLAFSLCAAGVAWAVRRRGARRRFERELPAKYQALCARIRDAIPRCGKMVLLREEPAPT